MRRGLTAPSGTAHSRRTNVSNLQNLNPLSFNTENPNFKATIIDQYNLQIEQQFGPNVLTIGCGVGERGHHLPQVEWTTSTNPHRTTKPNSLSTNRVQPFRPNSGPRKLEPQFPAAISVG